LLTHPVQGLETYRQLIDTLTSGPAGPILATDVGLQRSPETPRRPEGTDDEWGKNQVNWLIELPTGTLQIGTRLDGLNYLQIGDRFYNGFRAGHRRRLGTNKLGIETVRRSSRAGSWSTLRGTAASRTWTRVTLSALTSLKRSLGWTARPSLLRRASVPHRLGVALGELPDVQLRRSWCRHGSRPGVV